MKYSYLYLWYIVSQAQWDTCDQQVFFCLVISFHRFSTLSATSGHTIPIEGGKKGG